jgi:hypothetical protein
MSNKSKTLECANCPRRMKIGHSVTGRAAVVVNFAVVCPQMKLLVILGLGEPYSSAWGLVAERLVGRQ